MAPLRTPPRGHEAKPGCSPPTRPMDSLRSTSPAPPGRRESRAPTAFPGNRLQKADGEGRWSVDGRPAPRLDECLDLDLESSMLTNASPSTAWDWHRARARPRPPHTCARCIAASRYHEAPSATYGWRGPPCAGRRTRRGPAPVSGSCAETEPAFRPRARDLGRPSTSVRTEPSSAVNDGAHTVRSSRRPIPERGSPCSSDRHLAPGARRRRSPHSMPSSAG